MIKPQIPPGKTWVDTHKQSFADIAILDDQRVPTTEFLNATEATTTIFDLLGSPVFTPIKNDLLFNIGRIRDRQKEAPEESTTLQSLVESESASGSHSAVQGLTWLVRGLDFMAQAFRGDLRENKSVPIGEQKPPKEVAELFRASYKTALSPYHNFLIRPFFRAAMNAAPCRRDLYHRLSGESTEPEATKEALKRWVDALERIVEILKMFLAQRSDQMVEEYGP
ncbi:uncharacterized protein Z518_02449 [Rhinocladiella mackenziei CBS 650.93]|uniref:Glycolipid transfer protein domain-containing protein n=1 Tax=Rhinocladiella mackenziei CBS 650.93 TaxID=1442369 RepID=A0A0D2JF16_9EURO|nr:uncharacterized protein Z518_02449 [Rhinocladiella mackenziei CBS 650.93]KIX07795.1 hypothetical protein Z518_02449 [Rhinocladiella mackenziei CBS 650.93]